MPDALQVVCNSSRLSEQQSEEWQEAGQEWGISNAVVLFFFTSLGAVCAGSAQVTLFELRWSCDTGCNP